MYITQSKKQVHWEPIGLAQQEIHPTNKESHTVGEATQQSLAVRTWASHLLKDGGQRHIQLWMVCTLVTTSVSTATPPSTFITYPLSMQDPGAAQLVAHFHLFFTMFIHYIFKASQQRACASRLNFSSLKRLHYSTYCSVSSLPVSSSGRRLETRTTTIGEFSR